MSNQEAFVAAVNLIRSMPKEGPFQPSPHLMLRFYSLFKQATEGKCSKGKPAFWAVIEKAKWDAWKALGNMPKEEAMAQYVEELKQIVETMSYSENVANFMHVLGPFYEAVYDGQEPENLRRESSPQPSSETSDKSDHLEDESGYSSSVNGTGIEDTDPENNNKKSTEDREASPEADDAHQDLTKLSPATSFSSLYTSEKFYSDAESDEEYKDPLPDYYTSKPYYRKMNQETGEQLHVTMAIQRLQADIASLNGRLEALEQGRKDFSTDKPVQRSTVEQIGSFASTYSTIPNVNQLSLPSWFPFKNVNLATVIVVLGWPFVAQYVLARLRRKIAILN